MESSNKEKPLSLPKSGMDHDRTIEELLHRIIVALVDDRNEVQVSSATKPSGTIFQVTVAPADVGKIIGKHWTDSRFDQGIAIGDGDRRKDAV